MFIIVPGPGPYVPLLIGLRKSSFRIRILTNFKVSGIVLKKVHILMIYHLFYNIFFNFSMTTRIPNRIRMDP